MRPCSTERPLSARRSQIVEQWGIATCPPANNPATQEIDLEPVVGLKFDHLARKSPNKYRSRGTSVVETRNRTADQEANQ